MRALRNTCSVKDEQCWPATSDHSRRLCRLTARGSELKRKAGCRGVSECGRASFSTICLSKTAGESNREPDGARMQIVRSRGRDDQRHRACSAHIVSMLHDSSAAATGYSPSTGSKLSSGRGRRFGCFFKIRTQVFQRSIASSLPGGRNASAFSYHSIASRKPL